MRTLYFTGMVLGLSWINSDLQLAGLPTYAFGDPRRNSGFHRAMSSQLVSLGL